MGGDVLLIAAEIKPFSQFQRYGCVKPGGQTVQRLDKPRHRVQVRHIKCQRLGPALRQHLLNSLLLFFSPLTRFAHLLAKVLGVKYDSIKQKHRSNITAAIFTLISSYTQYRFAAAISASLKFNCWIKLIFASPAPAPALSYHSQRTLALRTAVAKEHNQVIESLCLCEELLHCCCHIGGELSDIHYSAICRYVGFWFFGVNFLPQLLQSLIFRSPIALVFLTPLLTVSVEPQPG